MQFGAMNFPVKPLLGEMEALAALGFDYIELTLDPPEAHYLDVRRQRAEIGRFLSDHGMGLVCHMPTFLFTADLTEGLRKVSIEETLQSLETAADLAPMKVVLHPSYIVGLGAYVREKVAGYAMEALEVFVARAEALGLTLCLENMFPPSGLLVLPDDFAPVFARFPSLCLLLDIGHASIGHRGAERPLAFLDALGGRLQHVHVSDNLGREDNHLPIGVGTIAYPGILEALVRGGYDGTVTLEVFCRDRDYLGMSLEKVKRMIGVAKRNQWGAGGV